MYNINDPDIIPLLTLLVGSTEKAVDLLLAAQHVCKIWESDTFNVQCVDDEWVVNDSDIISKMNKSMLHD